MTFLPIVQRELRIGSRRHSTYRTRWLAALLTCVLVSGALILSGHLTASTPPGESLFKLLASLAFIYCLLEGLRNTADCLSEEKREGTLGLLFLTDLKGYDVVLGKLLATSLAGFYGLLAFARTSCSRRACCRHSRRPHEAPPQRRCGGL